MKANRALVPLTALALTFALAACSAPEVVPQPTPRYTQSPRPLPPPPQPEPSYKDWRDAPATPGDWTWSMEGDRSTARFSGGLAFACDRPGRRVLLYRQGSISGEVPLTIQTQTATRQVSGSPASLAGAAAIAVPLAAGDSLLDAIAFSRGRFAVQAPGFATLYVPTWPEISRVIEDCR